MIIASGCKGKPTTQEPPPKPVGSGSAAAVGSGSGSAASQNDMQLPPTHGTPPLKSPKLEEPKIKELGALEYPTWRRVTRQNKTYLEQRYTSVGRPFVQVTINAGPCFDCLPMELDKWQAKESVLKELFPKSLADQPGTVFESGTADMNGATLVWTYQLGQTSRKDENDNTSAVFAHAYAIYWNDGVNMIRVVSEYKDLPMRDVNALATAVPREDLELVAKTFMDEFTHRW